MVMKSTVGAMGLYEYREPSPAHIVRAEIANMHTRMNRDLGYCTDPKAVHM